MGIDAGLDARRHQPIRVLVVSDVRLYREGIAAALNRRDAICVAGAVGGAESLTLAGRAAVYMSIVSAITLLLALLPTWRTGVARHLRIAGPLA